MTTNAELPCAPVDTSASMPAQADAPVVSRATPTSADIHATGSAQAAADASAFWQTVSTRPHRHDLFALLRRAEALHPQLPRLGRGKRPSQEPLRIGQEPSSAFAPSTVSKLQLDRDGGVPKLQILSFGLFGPNGPMPLVFTEHAHERAIHHGDRTLVEFADIFHHRLSLLFYRAWADAQSSASLDRGGDDPFTRFSSSLIAYGQASLRNRDTVADHARLNHAGHLVRQTRNAEGLAQILSNFFKVAVVVEEFVGRWLPIPRNQCTRLGAPVGAQLGMDAVAGRAVWDRQHRFRLRMGPMSRAVYTNLLPSGRGHRQLLDWVRSYIGIELDWDVRLVLAATEVPSARLGSGSRLGWTTWLGTNATPRDRDDLLLDPEHAAKFRPTVAHRSDDGIAAAATQTGRK